MNRRVIAVAVAVSVVLAGAWFVLLWKPQGATLAAAHARTTAATTTNEGLQLELARLKAAKAEEGVLRTDFDALREAIPDDPALARFLLDANDVATTSGVDFLSIAPGEPQVAVATGPPTIPLQITVNGGYYQALDYLDALSKMHRVVVVDSVSLTPGGDGQKLSIVLDGRMFTTTAPVAPGTAVASAPSAVPGGDAAQPVTTVTTPAPQITVTANKP